MSQPSVLLYVASIAAAGIVGYYLYTLVDISGFLKPKRAQKDYQQVYDEIAGRLEEDYHYDDGSYGPVLVRLAWHSSGTYDAKTGSGGCNGATMRFSPECNHGSNAGLNVARAFLEPVKGKHGLSLSMTPFPAKACGMHSLPK